MKTIKKKGFFVNILTAIFIVLIVFPLGVGAAPVCPSRGSTGAPSGPPGNFQEFVCILIDGLNLLVPVIIALALLVFIWGLTKFIRAAGDEKNIKAGKDLMIWGIIGLFVMVSVWGIVNILYGSFFQGNIKVPLLNTTPP